MENALSFLSEHKDVAFATVEGDKPKIRVFQIMKRNKDILYFATATHKEVYQQLLEKPCDFDPFGQTGFAPFGYNMIDPFGQNSIDHLAHLLL